MIISGVQQIGIGVPDVHEAWTWYRKVIGMDVPIFEEAAEASLMLPYTGGEPQTRHAILAINMNGGGGFEIWQYTSRTPQPASFEVQIGDLGINVAKLKSRDIRKSYTHMKKNNVLLLTEIEKLPDGREHYFFEDLYGNVFEVLASNVFFAKPANITGGTIGAIIGVSDMETSQKFYNEVLGYDIIKYSGEGERPDIPFSTEGIQYRYVSMQRSDHSKGGFGSLLGPTEIELIQRLDYKPKKIFKNRYWGDLGFIHLCYDIVGMSELRKKCEAVGHPFTVDSSNSFDMGEAAGHFTYIEDPDGSLIEFVETHKIPILKKVGWYLNLQKRDPSKSLPRWMIKALALNRKKD